MDIFTICLIVGIAGMACMGLLGVGHFGGTGHHAGHASPGGGHAGGGHAGSGHAGGGHAIGHSSGHAVAGTHSAGATHGALTAHNTNTQHNLVRAPGAAAHGGAVRGGARTRGGTSIADRLLTFLSPRAFFSVLLGFGLCGIVARSAGMGPSLRIVVAVVGALLFELLFVLPLWNLCFRFASNPALSLESAVAEEGRAVTDFDSEGNGIVSIDLNGQVVQLLGKLSPQCRAEGVHFRTGDSVFIDAVDAARGVCTVSKPGA